EFREYIQRDTPVRVDDDADRPCGRAGVLPDLLEVQATVGGRLTDVGPVGLGDDHGAPGVGWRAADPGRGRAGPLYRLHTATPAPWHHVGVPVPTPTPLTRRGVMTASARLPGPPPSGGRAAPTPEREPPPRRRLADAAGRDARGLAPAGAAHGPDAAARRRPGGGAA